MSVEGNVFHREAMRELAPPALVPVVDRSLTALVRRDVIRPDRSSFADDDAFRFRHILIRDAAYRSLPKETRARAARALRGLARASGAARACTSSRRSSATTSSRRTASSRELGHAGAGRGRRSRSGRRERLESAGRRALAPQRPRGGGHGCSSARPRWRPADDARRAALLPDLGGALIEAGRLAEAEAVLADAIAAAEAAGDERAAARALVQQEFLRLQLGEAAGTAEASAVVERVIPVFRRAGDEQGLCSALRLRAWRHWIEAQAEAAARGVGGGGGARAARAASSTSGSRSSGWIASSLFFGPTPWPEAIERCEAIRAEVEGNLVATADVLQPLAGPARDGGPLRRGARAARGQRRRVRGARADAQLGRLAPRRDGGAARGRPGGRGACLRKGYAALEEMGDRALLSTTAAFLGQALLAQGREEEAERFAELSAELAADDDVLTQAMWRGVRAASSPGAAGSPRRSGSRARPSRLAERTDFLNHTGGGARRCSATCCARSGRAERGAGRRSAEALDLYEQKGNRGGCGARCARTLPRPRRSETIGRAMVSKF